MINIINTEIIRNKRIEKGLPQRAIGAILDIDQSKVSNIEHGKKDLKFSEAVRLAEFLGISTLDLVRKQS